jgi:ubiquinone/menaquinone biosynthesis C-methylase UbiE
MSHERRFDPKSLQKLEAPDRGLQFPVDAILDAAGVCGALNVGPLNVGAMNVADIGAGSGYFTLPIARRVSPGKVYAVDVSTELLAVIRGKLAVDGAPENVELMVGEDSATGVAEGACDLIFLSAVWHEIDNHADALREFRRIAAPKARLAIVDWSPGGVHPPGPPLEHRVGRDAVERALEDGGWRVVKSEAVTDWTYIVVGQRQ